MARESWFVRQAKGCENDPVAHRKIRGALVFRWKLTHGY